MKRKKEPLDEGKREEWKKVGLKLNIKKNKIMASSPIILWQIEGEKVEAVTDFIFLGPERYIWLGRMIFTSFFHKIVK